MTISSILAGIVSGAIAAFAALIGDEPLWICALRYVLAGMGGTLAAGALLYARAEVCGRLRERLAPALSGQK